MRTHLARAGKTGLRLLSSLAPTCPASRKTAPRLAVETLEERALLDAGLGRLAALGDDPARLVDGLYGALLGRAADAGGAAYWQGQLASGQSATQLAVGILGSQEYASHGTDGWLASLYRDVLGRPADGDGLAFWDRTLGAGASRQDVARAVLGSGEARALATVQTSDVAVAPLVVQLRDGAAGGAERLRQAAAAGGAAVEDAGAAGLFRLRGGAADLVRLQATLAAQPFVQYAAPDQTASVALMPTDTSLGSLWGLTGTYGVQAPSAWDRTTGSSSVTVAVIDTGVDYNHPDLYKNIWVNQKEIPASRLANLTDVDGDGLITFWDLNDPVNQGPGKITDLNGDGRIDAGDVLAPMGKTGGADNGGGGWADGVAEDGDTAHVDDLVGWNFVNNTNNPMDDNNHGTHVSGTIGAIGNNGLGVAGVNWKTQIMAVKFLGANGSGSTSAAGVGLRYAVDHGARVSNNSYGGGGSDTTLYNAIAYANTRGHLFVAAAGNSGQNIDAAPSYPASYDLPNLVSVAAIDSNGGLASFSNYGTRGVDLGAPGVGIVSTVRNGGYASFNGTSMATPHVAGVAALVLGRHLNWTVAQLKNQLLGTATPLAALAGRTVTGGRLNAAAALGQTPPGLLPDWNGDGVGDLLVVHSANTASGQTEVEVLDGASDFQTALAHLVTPLPTVGSAVAFDFADFNGDGKPDLYVLVKSNTGSHSTEVHILDGSSNFQTWSLHTTTALGETDAASDFQVVDFNRDGKPDLVAFKKSSTGSNSTEIHVLDGATNFQGWLLHTGTALHETGAEGWLHLADVNRDGAFDLVYVKQSGTGSGHTEVHALDGRSGFRSFNLHAAAALPETGDEAEFRYADFNGDGTPDLFYVQKRNTGSGHTEVHVVNGMNLGGFLLQTATPLPELP